VSALDRFPDLPDHMRTLPMDHRGFPVPWFVAKVDGEFSFPVVDADKLSRAAKLGLCWVCGGVLGKWRASVIGPMCAINRTISEPQSHVECARFSARRCPFLANPRMKRVPEHKLPDDRNEAAGYGIKRNPGAVAVWIETKPTKPFRAYAGNQGWLFQLGDPAAVEWYAHGREATRAEVEESIRSGLPLLKEACDREPTERRRQEARDELLRRLADTLLLLPASLAGSSPAGASSPAGSIEAASGHGDTP
jgi:hypothetical protein